MSDKIRFKGRVVWFKWVGEYRHVDSDIGAVIGRYIARKLGPDPEIIRGTAGKIRECVARLRCRFWVKDIAEARCGVADIVVALPQPVTKKS